MRYCEWSGLPPPNLIPSSDFGPSPAWVSPSGENSVFVHSYSGQGLWQVWGWEGRVVSVCEVRARGGGACGFGAASTVETGSFAAVAPLSSFAGISSRGLFQAVTVFSLGNVYGWYQRTFLMGIKDSEQLCAPTHWRAGACLPLPGCQVSACLSACKKLVFKNLRTFSGNIWQFYSQLF